MEYICLSQEDFRDDVFQYCIFMWQFEREPEFDRKLGKWPKKYHRELQAMIDNLDTFSVALNSGVRVEQAKRQFSFLHGNYPHGILSIDQRGAGSSTKQSRLYTYPDEDNEVLYQLTLGDKKSQKNDVAFCKGWAERFVKKTKVNLVAKRYSSVTEMMTDSPLDESQRDEIAARIASRQIIKRLLALRAIQGMSQKEIAASMDCRQPRISKLENGLDDDIRLGDLREYLHALGHDMSLFICPKEWKSFQQIKFHAFNIRQCLGQLVDLAGDDPKILQGVSEAHIETLLDLVKLVVDSAKDLPSYPQMVPCIIEANDSRDVEPGVTHESSTASTP